MNKDEIKALSERALEMLEEQKAERERFDEGKLSVAPEYEMTAEDIEWWERCRELNEPIAVSERDFEAMLDAIENPPEPSEKIREAFARHNERVMKKQEQHNDKT